MLSSKAPGTDSIPAEVYKAWMLPMTEKHSLYYEEEGGCPTRIIHP